MGMKTDMCIPMRWDFFALDDITSVDNFHNNILRKRRIGADFLEVVSPQSQVALGVMALGVIALGVMALGVMALGVMALMWDSNSAIYQ